MNESIEVQSSPANLNCAIDVSARQAYARGPSEKRGLNASIDRTRSAQGGLVFVSDPVHGRVSTQLKGRYGYGSWLAPLVGVWELVIVGRMWCTGGAYRVAAMRMLSTLMGGAFYSLVVEGDLVGSLGPLAFTAMSVFVLGLTAAAAASQTSFFTLGALIAIGVSTFSPGKPNSEDSKLSRPFMGRQASWLSELSTSTTVGGKRD